MYHKNKAIGFAKELVPLIKNGSKALTYRLGDKYKFLKVGDRIKVKNSSTQENFAEVEINEVSTILFKNLPIDKEGHEKYSSKEEQRKRFEKYYPGEVKDNTEVVILGFKVVKPEDNRF